jgi:copper chaperone CopZ
MSEKTFNVTGMHCEDCNVKIKTAIEAADSAFTATPSWEAGTVSVTGMHCGECEGKIKAAIEGAGAFKVA